MHPSYNLLCLSHLRWDFVFQRPHHLLTRCARAGGRVFFVEEPRELPAGQSKAGLELSERAPGLTVVVPQLPAGSSRAEAEVAQAALLDQLLAEAHIQDFVLWYYTPMAVGFTRHLPPPLATVYDCMDELANFLGAPPELLLREMELFQRADLVFTGGQTLYEAKRRQHHAVHAFPSSVDVAHFARARQAQPEPADQAHIPHPRLGFVGVIDERLDVDLLAGVADLRPDWRLVLIGPVVKIDSAMLPRRDNIHYLGPKSYAELPAYLAGWDVALIPFARNEATRFVSPTKTPEYLAAGRPVVSTSIRDVVQPYGDAGLLRIADEPRGFVAAVEAAMAEDAQARIGRADAFLRDMSWDRTWASMDQLLRTTISARASAGLGRGSRAA